MIVWCNILLSVSYKWFLWNPHHLAFSKTTVYWSPCCHPGYAYTFLSVPIYPLNQEEFYSQNYPMVFDHIPKSNAIFKIIFKPVCGGDLFLLPLLLHSLLLFLNVPSGHTDLLTVPNPSHVMIQCLTSLRFLITSHSIWQVFSDHFT